MARNNLTWIKGDITGDIYFDHVHLEGKEVQFLRLILMIKGVIGAARGVARTEGRLHTFVEEIRCPKICLSKDNH